MNCLDLVENMFFKIIKLKDGSLICALVNSTVTQAKRLPSNLLATTSCYERNAVAGGWWQSLSETG